PRWLRRARRVGDRRRLARDADDALDPDAQDVFRPQAVSVRRLPAPWRQGYQLQIGPRLAQEFRRQAAAGRAVARWFARGRAAAVVDDQAWIENEFLPNVGKRGAAIIEARGASSAGSAASAAIDHFADWVKGSDGEWVSMGVPSDGSYGISEGLICGFPCTC